MYRIKDNVDLKWLEKYGFRIGREIPDNERCICTDYERDDYWLIPRNPFDPDKILYADYDFDQPLWSVHVQDNRRLWIECVPAGTYHIDNDDMEEMFYTLKCMIDAGLIIDDYKEV